MGRRQFKTVRLDPDTMDIVERICLKCQKKFRSGGNRICPKCTIKNNSSRIGRTSVDNKGRSMPLRSYNGRLI